MRFAGKVAIVTGAANGIGRAVARRFASEGANLILLDLERVPLATTANEITAAGGRVWTAAVDLSEVDGAREAINDGTNHFGRVDILVNNAARIDPRPMLEIAPDDWDR